MLDPDVREKGSLDESSIRAACARVPGLIIESVNGPTDGLFGREWHIKGTFEGNPFLAHVPEADWLCYQIEDCAPGTRAFNRLVPAITTALILLRLMLDQSIAA